MVSRRDLFAFACAAVCAGSLAGLVRWNRPTLEMWSLEQATLLVLLVAIGAWFAAPSAAVAAGIVAQAAAMFYLSRRGLTANSAVMLLPAPVCAAVIGRYVDARLRVWVTGASAVALLLVSAAVFAQSRTRLELLRNVRIPAFIQSIRQAEFVYAASGNGFTCDGTKLPNVGRLDWMPADTLRQSGYAVHLECSGRRFRIIVDPPDGKASYALDPNGRISVP